MERNRIVLYTAIFGGKDDIREPPGIIPHCDCICFTDNPSLHSSIFDVRICHPLYDDPVRSAKIFKILSHKYLSDYEYAIWVDGSVIVKTQAIVEILYRYLHTNDIAFFAHPDRDCIYEELKACIALKKDDPFIMQRQIAFYQEQGFPAHQGLVSAAIILRKNDSPIVRQLNESWWEEVLRFSRRDQLSFNFVAWKHQFSYEIIDGVVWDNDYFKVAEHIW